MDIFWIACLTILILLHQTMSASDTAEVIRAVGGSVTFHSHNPDRNVALWSFGSDPIVTVVFRNPLRLIFFQDNFKTRFAVSEDGHALSIPRLRMEDAGTYSVTIGDKRSTFTLQVFRKLAEVTVTCEAQNCLDGSCSCCLRCSTPGDTGSKECFKSISSTLAQPRAESPMQQVNETSQEELEPVTCTARNPVSSRNVIVTNLGVLHDAITTDPPSTGAHSGSWIWISIIAGVEFALFLIFLMCYCNYKCGREPRGCRVCSLWGRANLLARCEEPNTWLASKTHTKGAEHVSVEKQILLKTNKAQEKLSFLWPGDRLLASLILRFLPQLPFPPGVSPCHEQPPGVSPCHEQPHGQDQHQEQPPNPDWPRGQDSPAKILVAGAAPHNHGCLTMDFAPFMEIKIKSQERTVSCGDIGEDENRKALLV